MEEELEVVKPHWATKFKINGTIHMWLLITEEQLDTLVPSEAKNGTIVVTPGEYDEDGNELVAPVTRQKTVREFAPQFVLLGDGAALLYCNSIDIPMLRWIRFVDSDADDWAYFAGLAWGKTKADFLTKTDRDELLPEENDERI